MRFLPRTVPNSFTIIVKDNSILGCSGSYGASNVFEKNVSIYKAHESKLLIKSMPKLLSKNQKFVC